MEFLFLILILLFFLFRKPNVEGISNCQWSQWGPWTKCSENCGGGEQSRARANNGGCGAWPDNRQMETRFCNNHSCPSGQRGEIGDKGEQGKIGPPGFKGEDGKSIEIRGATGDIGIQGPEGEEGDVGDRGERGSLGPRGRPGLLINRGNRLKHDLARIYNTLKKINPETASKEYIQKTIGEGMSPMKAYNMKNYY